MRQRLRALLFLVRADFLERTRRYSFLITLGAMLAVGYVAVPAIDSGVLTVNLGQLRGVYNSAWVGSMVALLTTMLLSLPGFYLVKNAVTRDRRTGVGQIIAATPLSKALYILGKALSNLCFLTVILAVVLAGAAATQLLRGEVTRLAPWQLLAPFLFISLPTMALVAAVAVLFETIPFLKGGLGNIIYFVLFIVAIIISMSGVTFNQQGLIEKPINDLFGASIIGASMLQAAHAAYPQRQLDFGIGYARVEGTVDTFHWQGLVWTANLALQRLVWVGVALAIALLAALVFQRFDPARGPRRASGQRGPLASVLARLARTVGRLRLPSLGLERHLRLPPFGRALVAELRLALQGRIWWLLIALGLVVAAARAPDAEAHRGLLLAAWLWPVLVWSKLGVRESRHQTASIVFSTPHPLRRQFPALWLAGVVIAAFSGLGGALHLIQNGVVSNRAALAAWAVAALFIPTLALALGVWSRSSKTFEALYVVLWYIGPVSGLAPFDFMGLSAQARAAGMPLIYLLATVLLLAVAILGRRRQLRATD